MYWFTIKKFWHARRQSNARTAAVLQHRFSAPVTSVPLRIRYRYVTGATSTLPVTLVHCCEVICIPYIPNAGLLVWLFNALVRVRLFDALVCSQNGMHIMHVC